MSPKSQNTGDESREAVANPPVGGDQTQASTNDDNQNTVLQTSPWVVVAHAHGQVGVVSRFPSQGEAENDAAARRETLPASTTVEVMRENPDLPPLVAEVEAAEFGDPGSEEEPAPASTPKASGSAKSGK